MTLEDESQRLEDVQYATERASLEAQMVQSLPAVRETWVQSLGQEDPLEKEMATHCSTLCLENPMNRGAWWATVHRVTKSLSDFTFTCH